MPSLSGEFNEDNESFRWGCRTIVSSWNKVLYLKKFVKDFICGFEVQRQGEGGGAEMTTVDHGGGAGGVYQNFLDHVVFGWPLNTIKKLRW